MKLIDILVQELPKRGGWPAEALFAMQDSDKLVKFSKSKEKIRYDSEDESWCSEEGYDWIRKGRPFEANFTCEKATDHNTTIISRKQYEAALKQPVWDGTGLPPVGVECEWQDKNTKEWVKVLVAYASEWVTVIRENKPVDPVELAIDNYGDEARRHFRPIRSERDRIAEALILFLDVETDIDNVFSVKDVSGFMDYISEGKIPGVKLSD